MLYVALLAGLAVAGSVYVWVALVQKLRRGEELVPLKSRRPAPWSALDLILVFFTFCAFQLLAQVLLRDVYGIQLTGDIGDIEAEEIVPSQLLFNGASLLTVLFAGALTRLRVGASARDWGFSTDHFASDLRLAAVAFVALAAPIYGLQGLLVYFFPVQHPLIELLQREGDAQSFAVIGISVVLVAPLCEEVFFRVLLQGWFEKLVTVASPAAFPQQASGALSEAPSTENAVSNSPSVGHREQAENPYRAPQTISRPRAGDEQNQANLRAIPIVASALAFALLHVGQGPAPVPLFFFALALGYLYQKTHRIWPSLILHLLLNGVSLALLWLDRAIETPP
jgi:membrane protease YdiL (CAAX protease family)